MPSFFMLLLAVVSKQVPPSVPLLLSSVPCPKHPRCWADSVRMSFGGASGEERENVRGE